MDVHRPNAFARPPYCQSVRADRLGLRPSGAPPTGSTTGRNGIPRRHARRQEAVHTEEAPHRRRHRARPARSASASSPSCRPTTRIGRIVGIARRPFDPAEHGWTKMEYRQGDVRDPDALEAGVRGRRRRRAPRVHDHRQRVARHDPRDQRRGHAQRVPRGGGRRREALRLRVVGGRLRLPPRQPRRDDGGLAGAPGRAAVLRAGEGRARAAAGAEAAGSIRSSTLYLLRPPVVLGPHAIGAKDVLPGPARAAGPAAARRGRAGCPCPCPRSRPTLPLQFIHEDDVGQALLQCVVAAGPPGAYNIAGDGVLTGPTSRASSAPRPVPVPAAPVQRRRARGRCPAAVPAARRSSGSRPRATRRSWTPRRREARARLARRSTAALEALRATLPSGRD